MKTERFWGVKSFFKKSLDFLVFLYYNQLTSRHEFQQWTGQSHKLNNKCEDIC